VRSKRSVESETANREDGDFVVESFLENALVVTNLNTGKAIYY
jgi:hypothetical protein